MKDLITLHIYAKRINAASNARLPIYFRLTINSERYEFSTKKFVDAKLWSAEMCKVKGKSEEACTINNYLDVLKNKIFDIQLELAHKKIPLTITAIKNELIGTEDSARMLIPIFQDHNNRIKELVGKEYAPGTLERYKTSLTHTVAFSVKLPANR